MPEPSYPIYAIGDIHGELDMLKAALRNIENDGGTDARIVFIGDYVDRGPESRGVIELLMNGMGEGRNWVCLLGNHDEMFSLFMEEHPRQPARLRYGFHWLHERIGGRDTLASYGVVADDDTTIANIHQGARASVPQEHLDFIDSLPNSHQEGGVFFVHAGIRPGVALDQQDDGDLLWIRDEFLIDTRQHPLLVVHGHTPVDHARHYGNRVNLDTGCGYGDDGYLTVAVFEQGMCWELTASGRELLPEVPLLA